MAYRISVDIGGTFTDLAAVDMKVGECIVAKSLTTPEKYIKSVENCLNICADKLKISVEDLLKNTEIFIHGTTIGVNALITGNVANTGLIVTKGFKDILLFREGGKDNPYDFGVDYPDPFIPRYLTIEADERITSEGEILKPLNKEKIIHKIRELKEKYKIEALAVALLWSCVNPIHELKIKEICDKENITCSLSSEVLSTIREYRRTSTVAIDASLKQVVADYIKDFYNFLKSKGYQKELLISNITGGVVCAKDIIKKPVIIVNSGPILASFVGLYYGERETGSKNIITSDLGGTSFDVCLIRNGETDTTREHWVGEKWIGNVIGVSSVDINSIGAGGGSIAWVDSGGLLHVGPQSAGSSPGPACYKRGGKKATLTDALLILGYLPEYLAEGSVKIYPELAKKAIKEQIAQPLQLTLEEAAYTILIALQYNMISAIEDITVKRGINPAEYILVAGGGMGPLVSTLIAKELRIKTVVVPKFGGVMSSLGGLYANIQNVFSQACFTESRMYQIEKINKTLDQLKNSAEKFLSQAYQGEGKRQINYFVEARYSQQTWEIEVPLRTNKIKRKEDIDEIVEDFHKVHKSMYSVSEPGQYIEFITFKAKAVIVLEKPKMVKKSFYEGISFQGALKGKREVYFKDLGKISSPIFQFDKLPLGIEFSGPAIIEEPTTTVVIPPETKCKITDLSYVINIIEDKCNKK